MTSLSLRIVGITVLFLAGASPSCGQPPLDRRIDPYGDPLPEGAIARLGTLRLTHLGGIEAVAISPDGRVAASGVHDGKETYLGRRIVHESKGFTLGEGVRVTAATIRLWNVKTGKLLRQFSTPDAPVSHIRFSPDGKRFFAGCGKFLCCWESETGKKVWEQEAIVGGRFNEGVHLKEIMQAGDTLASLHSGRIICPVESGGGVSFHYHVQRVVRFWNARTGERLPLHKALESTIEAKTRVPILLHQVALTPDLKRAAIAVSEGDPLPRDRDRTPLDEKWKYANSRVDLIDLAAGKILLSIPNPDGEFGQLAIAPDGGNMAALTGKTIETPFEEKGTTGVTVDTRKDLWFATVGGGDKRLLAKKLDWIQNLAFVAKDRLAANDSESKVTVWRLDTGARLEKHDIGPEAFAPACAAGVAVKSWENTVRLIDVKSGKPIHAFEGHRSASSLRFAIHSMDTLISRDGERAIFWDARSWKPTHHLPMPNEERNYGWFRDCDAEFDHGVCVEKGIYLKKGERKLELRDIKSGKIVRRVDEKSEHYGYYFSPAGNRLMCEEDGSYAFFDVETGKRLAQAAGDPGNVVYMWYRHAELSTHGKYFAKAATDVGPAIELYDVDTGKLLRQLTPKSIDAGPPSGRASILKFKFSPDEQVVFGEVHETIRGDKGFSGERVSVFIWNAETGDVLQRMVLDPAMYVFWRETLSRSLVGVMAISSDHRLVALARIHGRSCQRRFESTPIEIWEVASGLQRGELTGHGPIADLAFSPDGRRLASSSDDTTILIWDLNRPLQPLKRRARLTEKELDDCWKALFERDAAKADLAIWTLVECPDDSLPYLKKKLRPAPIPDADHVRSLLADLDSDDFKTRTRADFELAKFGELILTGIDRALKKTNKLETQRRLESLAKKARASSQPFGSMTRIREWRAVEVVEKIGRPMAIEVLRDLATGCPGSQLTIAAKTALTRAEAGAKALR